jgi:hypothetical protein
MHRIAARLARLSGLSTRRKEPQMNAATTLPYVPGMAIAHFSLAALRAGWKKLAAFSIATAECVSDTVYLARSANPDDLEQRLRRLERDAKRSRH